MTIKRLTFLLLLFTLACKKTDKTDPNPGPAPIVNPVSSEEVTIQISVLNSHSLSNPMATKLTIESKDYYPNKYGNFTFRGLVADPDKVVIKVDNPEREVNYVTVVTEKGGSAYAKIDLLFRDPRTFSSTVGGSVSTASTKITFLPNSFVKKDMTPYSGNVKVYFVDMYYQFNSSPGDRRGVDKNGNVVFIESPMNLGYFLRITDENGNELNVNKPFSYAVQSNAEIAATLPSTFPSWNFDQTALVWKEAGTVNSAASGFSAQLTALGYNIIGVPHPTGLLKTSFSTIPASNTAGLKFEVGVNKYDYAASYTNTSTKVWCYIPTDVPIKYKLSNCLTMILEGKSTQPFVNKVNQLNWQVAFMGMALTKIRGKVEDCSFNTVTGSAELNLNGVIYTSAITNGYYNFTIPFYCNESNTEPWNLEIFDTNHKKIGNGTLTLTAGKDWEAPPLNICEKLPTGTVTLTAQNVSTTFTLPQDVINHMNIIDPNTNKLVTVLEAQSKDKSKYFYVTYSDTKAGTFPIYTFSFNSPGRNYMLTWLTGNGGTISVAKYKSGNTIFQGSFTVKTSLNFDIGSSFSNVGYVVDGVFDLKY